MSNGFQLQDAQDAQDYLSAFDARTRQKGESYFRGGRVRDLTADLPGVSYSAQVQGSQLYEVSLVYDEDEGWTGSCTCPMEFDCKHAYAAMKALLAEHSVAAVRGLSSGLVRRPGLTASKKGGVRVAGQVGDLLEAALDRGLRPEERHFVNKLADVYRRCCVSRHINSWDFQELGLHLSGYGWDSLRIWPSFPENEHEFWLYVANAARERGVGWPRFMQPVTDLALIQERVAHWRRAQEIERWKGLLNLFDAPELEPAAPGRLEMDLRLALSDTGADLEWKRAGQDSFSRLKHNQFRQLLTEHRAGQILFSPEAELLCQVFENRLLYGTATELRYNDPNGMVVLGRLLRLPALDSRLVNSDGDLLCRTAEPLRWAMAAAENKSEDYRLRLVQADGTPAPPLLCALAGNPPLYVSRQAIFTGPPVRAELLDPTRENLIPAPALETVGGLRLLHSLRVDLPPRLRERVREVPLQVTLDCHLAPTYPGSKTEQCVVRAVAHSPDMVHEEVWNGQGWQAAKAGPAGRGSRDDDGAILVFNRAALANVPRLLEPLGLKLDGYLGQLALRVTRKFPEVFADWLRSLPAHLKVQLAGDLASFQQAAVAGRVRLDVSEAEIDWFDLRVVLDVSDTTLTPEEIKLLLNAKGGFVRLGNKGWRRLQFDLTAEEDERLARLGLNPHELTSEPQRLHALQLADDAAKRFLPEQQAEQIQRRASEIKARVTPDLPAGVTADMRPYQLDGFHFLSYLAANRFGGILADDMGLGKTLQALAWVVWLREQNGHLHEAPSSEGAGSARRETGTAVVSGEGEGETGRMAVLRNAERETGRMPVLPSLVVCPKSVMDNWHAEAGRFTPGLRVKSWPAAELDRFLERLGEADLHVINYSQLRLLGESLLPVKWQALILDEGQYIKNPSSQTAQVARALPARHRLILSGTPIENRLLDLWSLMAFAMPGVLGSRHQFGKLYDAKGDPFARRRLAARVRPFLLRRTKSQVAKDLPDRVEEDLFCEIEGEQKTLYRAELKRAQQMLLKIQTQKQLAQERFHFLVSLLRLRQICCHPALVQKESRVLGAKVEALLEQLEPIMEEGQKVLVFSQFVELLGLLKPVLETREWPLFYLAGDTENRGELVQRFQTAEGPAVFLISLKAGGFGLNLTAASYVVLFDPWWNPAVENQAIDRTHRIGQTNKVIAYRLLIKDSIEEKIRLLQKKKKALVEDVLGEEKFAHSLTIEDLQFLFAD
jgi:hypothetical protein